MYSFILQLALLGSAAAGITLQAFTDSTCGDDGGIVRMTVADNPSGDIALNSGCQSSLAFNSVDVTNADPGSTCNIFSDTSCSNFVATVSQSGCSQTTGQSIICFAQTAAQALSKNPFALSTAQVTVGTKAIAASTGSFFGSDPKGQGAQIAAAVSQACAGGACDDTNPLSLSFTAVGDCGDPRQCGSTCSQTISVEGNFDNNDQRDYMSNLLQTALTKASNPNLTGVSGLACNDGSCQNVISFGEVVINDKDGNNQAEMIVRTNVQCANNPSSDIDCQGILGTVTAAALGAVPEVGGLLALTFTVGCAVASGGS